MIPGSGRFLGEGNGYSFQYSCLENSIDRGSSGAIFHGVTKVYFSGNKNYVKAGSFVTVMIDEVLDYDLIGHVTSAG